MYALRFSALNLSPFVLTALFLSACNTFGASTPEIPVTEAPQLNLITLSRGNPQRTGVYNLSAILTAPQVQWQVRVSATWLMPPLLAEGILYTGSGSGTIYALNAQTGETLWSTGGFGQLESTGAIAGDLLVAGGYNNEVRALNRHTGEELWSFATPRPVQAAPLIVGERVIIATDQAVYALDLGSGQRLWEVASGNENAFMGAPAYDEGILYTTGGSLLLALDSESGKELWRVKNAEQFLALAVANGLVYVGNWDGALYAFDQLTGEQRWKYQARAGEFWSAPAVSDAIVYVGNGDQFLYALNAHSGELIWSFKTAGRAVSEPLVADGVVYVSDSSHEFPRGPRHLYALDALTGAELWVFETVSTFLPAPALGDGVIYITSTGEVIALK